MMKSAQKGQDVLPTKKVSPRNKQKCFPKTAPDMVSQTKARWRLGLHWGQLHSGKQKNKSNVKLPQFNVSSPTSSSKTTAS